MKRVVILVEGQTEETFVREMLQPHLREKGVYLESRILSTGGGFGPNDYPKIKADLVRLLNQQDVVLVTTMLDFYGLPKNFPGYGDLSSNQSGYDKVTFLENAFTSDIDSKRNRFLAYLSLHEFEAILFAKVEAFAKHFHDQQQLRQLQELANQFESPEEINDDVQTSPSHRLAKIINGYQKVLHGNLIALDIGLATIRQKCPHFNQWLDKLEKVSNR